MIKIEEFDFQTPSNSQIEIVERKGLGHPDTICDNLSELFSRELSKYYLRNFNFILHHNLDKAILIGGKAEPKFGGGKILQPIEIKIVGRAITNFKKNIDLERIYLQTAFNYFKNNFRFLTPKKDVIFSLGVREGSIDLVSLFKKGMNSIPLANDTSFGVGYAPFTKLEELVLKIEKYLNLKKVKSKYPFIGEDIKVMGIRFDNKIKLIIACAFVDRFIKNIDDYLDKKNILKKIIENKSKEFIKNHPIEILINAADIIDDKIIYLTVSGTSAEAGDDGQVGRGNRVNGLITPYRPMSLEAAAGKNPVSHVGKIYNIFANRLAQEIIKNFKEVKETYVYIVSQIGYPINKPQILNIKIKSNGKLKNNLIKKINELAEKRLNLLPNLWKKIINGDFDIC